MEDLSKDPAKIFAGSLNSFFPSLCYVVVGYSSVARARGIVDVIISNCVINLSSDKDKVFREAFRVLKPRGRMLISDIVTQGELPSEIREDPEMWVACVAGALDEKVYLQKIMNAGFEKVEILGRSDSMEMVSSIKVRAYKSS